MEGLAEDDDKFVNASGSTDGLADGVVEINGMSPLPNLRR
jgi:hypothetical protein